MNSGFYEEIMRRKDLRDVERDANESYVNEEFSEIERINFIFKKGKANQQKALIMKLPHMLKNVEIFQMFTEHIIAKVEICQSDLLIAFADALSASIAEMAEISNNQKVNYDCYEGLINTIIKFFIEIITNERQQIRDEFLKNFNDFIEILNKKFRVTLTTEIIEIVNSMGSFSQTPLSRRYSAYFCSALIRIEHKVCRNETLLKRFIILFSDPDLVIRTEIAYQIRFVFEEIDEIYIKRSFYNIVDNYLTENDIIIKSEFIISVLINIEKFTDSDFIQKYVPVLMYFFEVDYHATKHFDYVVKVFRAIIKYSQNYQTHRHFIEVIKYYLNKFFLVYDKSDLPVFPYEYIIEDFHLISKILKINGENNLWTDFYNYMLRQVFENGEKCDLSLSATNSNNGTIDYKLIFFQNIDKLVSVINKQLFNKNLSFYFFNVFKEEETQYQKDTIKNLKAVFLCQTENEEFFVNIVSNFDFIALEIYKQKEWRVQIQAIKAFKSVIELLYKNENSVTSLIFHSSFEDFSSKIYNFIRHFIKSENYQLQINAIKLLCKNLRFCKNKDEIIKYAVTEFFDKMSFYKRRLYLIYFKYLLKNFSINYINSIGVLDNIFEVFDDTPLNVATLISMLPDFYPLINDMSEIKFKVLNKLAELKKKESLMEDQEVSSQFTRFNSWEDHYRRNKDSQVFISMITKNKSKMEEERITEKKSSSKELKDQLEKKQSKKKSKTFKMKTISNTALTQLSSNNLVAGSSFIINNNNRNLYHRKSTFKEKGTNVLSFPLINKTEPKINSSRMTGGEPVNKTPEIKSNKSKELTIKNSFSSSLNLKRDITPMTTDNKLKVLSSKEVMKNKPVDQAIIYSPITNSKNYNLGKVDINQRVLSPRSLLLDKQTNSNSFLSTMMNNQYILSMNSNDIKYRMNPKRVDPNYK